MLLVDELLATCREGESRVKPHIKQVLITPYGDLANGALRLGDERRYQRVSV